MFTEGFSPTPTLYPEHGSLKRGTPWPTNAAQKQQTSGKRDKGTLEEGDQFFGSDKEEQEEGEFLSDKEGRRHESS